MKISSRTLALFLLLAAWLSVRPPLALRAQRGPVVSQDDLSVDYPHRATFRLSLAETGGATQATLRYRLSKFSCVPVTVEVPAAVEGSAVSWTWVMNRSGNPPPGAHLEWQWTLYDAAGRELLTTPTQTHTFADARFDWRTVAAPGINLHWYRGDDIGPLLLEAAITGLERLERDMGIELQADVQFFIYGDPAAMREAVLYIQDWAGGVAFSEYNIILLGVQPDSAADWGVRTVQHELAHLVVAQFARSCVGGSLPTWLNEGLAMVAEGEPEERTRADLEHGVTDDAFLPVRSLAGAFPAHDSGASLAYSQSYSLVDYLLETHGPAALQQLLQELAQGAGIDPALERVYGFNQDGLELAWRAALGAPARTVPPTPTPLVIAALPTAVPFGGQSSVATPPAAAATAVPAPADSNTDRGGCALGLAPVGLAILLVWTGRAPRRRRRGT